MPLADLQTIPQLSIGADDEIDSLVPDTLVLLAVKRDGTIQPIATRNSKPREITQDDLKGLCCRLQAFPEAVRISEVESDEGCKVISMGGKAVFVPC
jgi:hypothetical protein